jgi:integrator complex subunit 11
MTIKAVPLGAGQDVGRSCIIVTLGRKNIMFDCGMHMGYNDERRFPDFKFISRTGQYTQNIYCVIISHFHLDHCGALPYFTEVCGYDGPIYMTYPTKAICPILLEDFRRITVERRGETNFFSADDVKACMKKVTAVNLHQTVVLDNELEIRAYYAGHVLGAALFYVKDLETGKSVVYTGDYNMTPDRHLGGASIERLRPDLLITETTYATTIRDSKISRERDFLKQVHQCIEKGGKVLIPVFALGRAQELCILLETYWDRMNLGGRVPIYFSAGLVERANFYYQLFINWTNEKIKNVFVNRNMFQFKYIEPFDRAYIDKPGPMVLFATPGMLHAGMSLEVFKRWAPNELNMVIIPGYCVEGTVGNKVLHSKTGKIEIDKKTTIHMKCGVKLISFSAHADAKGILQLIRQAQPRNIMLVHGEKDKMRFFKEKIERDFKIKCFDPPNGCTVNIPIGNANTSLHSNIAVNVSLNLLKRSFTSPREEDIVDNGGEIVSDDEDNVSENANIISSPTPTIVNRFKKTKLEGILISRDNELTPYLVEANEAASQLGLKQHKLKMSTSRTVPFQAESQSQIHIMQSLYDYLCKQFQSAEAITFNQELCNIAINSLIISFKQDNASILQISWLVEDDALAEKVLSVIDDQFTTLLLNLK